MRRIKQIKDYFVAEDEKGASLEVTQEEIEKMEEVLTDRKEFYLKSENLKEINTSNCIKISREDTEILAQGYYYISCKIKADMEIMGDIFEQVTKRVPKAIRCAINKEIKTINENIDVINLCHYECATFFVKSENGISRDYGNIFILDIMGLTQAGIVNLVTICEHLNELKKYLTKPETEIVEAKRKEQKQMEDDLLYIQDGIATLVGLLMKKC